MNALGGNLGSQKALASGGPRNFVQKMWEPKGNLGEFALPMENAPKVPTKDNPFQRANPRSPNVEKGIKKPGKFGNGPKRGQGTNGSLRKGSTESGPKSLRRGQRNNMPENNGNLEKNLGRMLNPPSTQSPN